MSPVQDISPDNIPDDMGSPGKGDSVDTADLGSLSLDGDGFPDAPAPKPDDAAAEETPAAEPEGEQPEGEEEGEPAAAEEYTEADLVKELNLGDHKTVKDALAARDAAATEQVNGLKTLFSKAGIELLGNNLNEITQELEYRLTHNSGPAQTPPTPTPDAQSQAQPLSLDGVFAKYGDRLELDDTQKALFSDMMGAVRSALSAEFGPAIQGLNSTPAAVELLLDHQWYNDAKAAAGDAPIPPFEEARRLLNANPKLREWAGQRREIFGDLNANPMKDVFSQWAGSKNALGLTQAEAKKRDEAAIKARNFKRTLTPGSVPKAKPKTNAQMSNKELGDTMHNIPIHEAFPQG